MADTSEVEEAFVTFITAVLYPTGSSNPSSIGSPARIYRGWPNAAALDADLAAGVVNVSVFADPGMSRNTSRYPIASHQISTVAPTITVSVLGNVVTFGGTVTAGNVVGIETGAPIAAYAYMAQSGDTLASVSTAIAAKIPGASSTGAAVTLPSPLNLSAAVMTPQSIATEVRRQDQGFRISCWCNTPTMRDTVAGGIDNAIAGMRDANGNLTRFMQIKTGETGWVRYLRSYASDVPTKATLWRRDLLYTVEYPTTLIEQDPAMLFGGGALWKQGVVDQFGAVEPSIAVLASPDGLSVFIDAAGNIIGAQPTS